MGVSPEHLNELYAAQKERDELSEQSERLTRENRGFREVLAREEANCREQKGYIRGLQDALAMILNSQRRELRYSDFHENLPPF